MLQVIRDWYRDNYWRLHQAGLEVSHNLPFGKESGYVDFVRKDRFGDLRRAGRLIVWDRETVMCDSQAYDGVTSEDIFYRHYEIANEDELRLRLEELAEAILAGD